MKEYTFICPQDGHVYVTSSLFAAPNCVFCNKPMLLHKTLDTSLPSKPKSILQEAQEISGSGDRARDYGTPLVNHQRIADIWNVQLGQKLKDGSKITPREVALMMIGLKLAREIQTSKRDNIVDIVGYANCIDHMENPS